MTGAAVGVGTTTGVGLGAGVATGVDIGAGTTTGLGAGVGVPTGLGGNPGLTTGVTVGVGVITKEDALAYGITGPNLRGTGIGLDLRKDKPYSGYETFPYPEYSEVFFGSEYKVLRGGSWATRPGAD